ncbi:hypothetical protein B7P43_G02712 [Cryptotermes secundus]|uniref:Lipase n=1 Tax=Cryptotermes secundus TaxID=105785 RepID=A0A2J7RQG0_9NEOP|nr:hypothetical protein B7P43_G02712 [Cryptotermes secundus]
MGSKPPEDMKAKPRGDGRDYVFETSGKPAVFLQHGVLASSLDWVLTGPHKALGYKLSDAGYDVWMGNLRGTIYSARHKNFNNTQPEFWNYSWHEIGMYDLPAMVDYVLRVTGDPDLHFVGHSMGATTAVVMLSERPEYNSKLKITLLLAPVVKLEHNTSIFRHSASLWKALQRVTSYSGLHGFPPHPELIQRRLEPMCEEQYIGRGLCANILHVVAGYSKELNHIYLHRCRNADVFEKVRTLIMEGRRLTMREVHVSVGVSRGSANTVLTEDSGMRRMAAKFVPKLLPLEQQQLRLEVAQDMLECANRDPEFPKTAPYSPDMAPCDFWLFPRLKTPLKADVSWLADQFRNLIGNFLVPSASFSHLSFLWATNVDRILYDPMISLLDRYKQQ